MPLKESNFPQTARTNLEAWAWGTAARSAMLLTHSGPDRKNMRAAPTHPGNSRNNSHSSSRVPRSEDDLFESGLKEAGRGSRG